MKNKLRGYIFEYVPDNGLEEFIMLKIKTLKDEAKFSIEARIKTAEQECYVNYNRFSGKINDDLFYQIYNTDPLISCYYSSIDKISIIEPLWIKKYREEFKNV